MKIPLKQILDMILVESSAREDVTADGGQAHGCLQIHKICVEDVNRIMNEDRYVHEDAFDVVKSIEMMRIYICHWCTEDRIGRPVTLQDAARIWNGGARGYEKPSTVEYWERVEHKLNQLNSL